MNGVEVMLLIVLLFACTVKQVITEESNRDY